MSRKIITKLAAGRPIAETHDYDLGEGRRVTVATLYETEDDDAEIRHAIVAWNKSASDEGAGAELVLAARLPVFLRLRWPSAPRVAGFQEDGTFVEPRGPGRPRLVHGRRVLVSCKLSEDEAARVRQVAARGKLTVSAWLQSLISRELEKKA